MNTSSRILIGTVIAFLIIGAGLAVGFYFNNKKMAEPQIATTDADKSPALSSDEDMHPARIKPSENVPVTQATDTENTNGKYDVSPPSRGATIDTVDVNIHANTNTAFVMLPSEQAKDIKKGQKILLYNARGLLLEALGEVTAANPCTGKLEGNTTVHMVLNGDADVPASTMAKGKIIIDRSADAMRLPLSALVKNDKDQPFVWEAVQARDGTFTAHLKPAKISLTTYAFFVIEADTTSRLYILNPDKDLNNGDPITVSRVMYAGPDKTDETKIAALIDSRNKMKLAAATEERIIKQIGDAKAGKGCVQAPSITKDFMNKIKTMSEPVTK